jgi:hypothetical protein
VDFAVCYRTNVEGLHCLPTLACNGFGLGEGGELEVQMFILAQMLIRIPNVQI